MRVTKTYDGKEPPKFWEENFTDESAADYMATYGEGPGCDTRLMLSSLINEGESVLDVGCGPGWNLDHFEQFGPKLKAYRGLDYSRRFIKVANARWNNTRSFGVGDVRNIHEAHESWDVVILQDVLEHTNGYEKPVRSALRVAKKRVIVSFWHLAETDDPHINDDGSDTYGSWYDKREWEEFLDSLDLHWLHDELVSSNGKTRDFYVIDKETPHGKGA